MKSILVSLGVLVIFILLNSCETAEKTVISSGKSLSKVVQTIDTVRKKFIEIARADLSLSPGEALAKTEEWLSQQPEVKQSFVMDDAFIRFTLQSGLEGYFTINLTDENGLSLTRGGSEVALDNPLTLKVRSENVLTNKKVLIFSPFVSDTWYASLYKEAEAEIIENKIKSYDNEFEVTNLYKADTSDGKLARQIKELESMGEYGLVILNTHGLPDGFYTSSWVYGLSSQFDTTEAAIREGIDYLRPGTYDQILEGYFKFAYYTNLANVQNWQEFLDERFMDPPVLYLVVTSKFIKSIPSLENTIIFGNMCYSGWNLEQVEKPKPGGGSYKIEYEPIREAFLSHNPIAYYAYAYPDGKSAKVGNKFAKAMEDSLTRSLIRDLDSTGRAYRNSEVEEFTGQQVNDPVSPDMPFKLFGAENYSYDNCQEEIFDVRDGQKYQVVCIGDQVWMAENLRYSGNITQIIDEDSWVALWNDGNPIEQPAWSHYNNDPANDAVYGKLYNWHAANTGQLCPAGWHIPTDEEWGELISFLGGRVDAGGKMKSTTGWNPPNFNATNSSGFSGFPGGLRSILDGQFSELGSSGYWWSSTTMSTIEQQAYFIRLNSITDFADRFNGNKLSGMSCRCVKD